MSNTPNFGLPRPVEDANVDDEFRRLQDAWDLLDAILTVFQVGIAGKSSLGHVHTISQINGLAAELAKKMDASKSFAIGDLSDVVGAAQAALGYVLAKSANGFTFQSAASLLGAHQHKVNEIVGLAQELLDIGTAVSEKATTARVNQLQTALNDLAISAAGVPIGTIIDVYGNGATTPPGFLKVVPGLEVTPAYPELRTWALANGWATNGSGNPVFPSTDDALFKRQWRAGQTLRDVGRAFGTLQADAFQGHWHALENINNGAAGGIASNPGGVGTPLNNKVQNPISDGVNGVPRTASETRPANITVTWYIRAYNAPLDTATVAAAQVISELAEARARLVVVERGWEVIEDTGDLANLAAYVKTGLDAFRQIRINGAIRPAVMNTVPYLVVSSDNGATWINSGYYVSASGMIGVSSGYDSGTSAYGGFTPSYRNLSNAYDFNFEGMMLDFNKAKALSKYYTGQAMGVDNGNAYFSLLVGGAHPTAAALNAIRFVMSAGAFSGRLILEGRRG